jgi:hypothetical protein
MGGYSLDVEKKYNVYLADVESVYGAFSTIQRIVDFTASKDLVRSIARSVGTIAVRIDLSLYLSL